MGGAAATYQMPVDPSSAMASNSQSQDALQAMNLGSADKFDAAKAIKPIDAHPEAVAQGAIKGAQSLISSVAGAYGDKSGGALDAFMKSKNAKDLPTQDQADSAAGGAPAMSSWRTIG